MTGSGLSLGAIAEEARFELYAGLDLSRKRLDFHLLDAEGVTVDLGASPEGCQNSRRRSVVLVHQAAETIAAADVAVRRLRDSFRFGRLKRESAVGAFAVVGA